MYKINVSRHGQHYFKIEDNSMLSFDIYKLRDELDSLYPECEGYEITLSHWTTSGTEMPRARRGN